MTFEQLLNAGFVVHHTCALCNRVVGYQVHPEVAAACFHSSCDCGGPSDSYRLLTRAELAALPEPEWARHTENANEEGPR